jgi:hypothetical protein
LPRRKQKLPAEFLRRPQLLARQRVRQRHARQASGRILLVQLPSSRQLPLQRRARRFRQHHDAIVGSLAVTDYNLVPSQVQVASQPREADRAAAGKARPEARFVCM